MMALEQLEAARMAIQDRLESEKTHIERNRLGQFATPIRLARDVVECAKAWLPRLLKLRFIDPAFGTGSFYSALLKEFAPQRIAAAEGYEIDTVCAEQASALWSETFLKLHVEDFTVAEPPVFEDARFNLLICNPPYVRHHYLKADEKLRLQRIIEQRTGIRLSGLAGLYCYFLCLADAWMAPGGLAGWLIPSEFMDVNYGREVKRYLFDHVTLLRIHRFEPLDRQFEDAIVSSAVVWFKKATPPADHVVEFSYGGSLRHPRQSRTIPLKTLRHLPKWTQAPFLAQRPRKQEEAAAVTLGDLFEIKRGIATGANEFFILTGQQTIQRELPARFLQPILPSPRHLSLDEVSAEDDGTPLVEPRLFLLRCTMPERDMRSMYPTLRQYLQEGIAAGLHERYLCRHRTPWYLQEERPPAPLLCTYMGRGEGRHSKPFRFILNHSTATAANVYLMLYPKEPLKTALASGSMLLRMIWQALNAIPMERLMAEGRVYGGGLYKLEPKELAGVSAEVLFSILRDQGTSWRYPRQLCFQYERLVAEAIGSYRSARRNPVASRSASSH